MQPTVGFTTHVTCRLTAQNRDQLRNPTLGKIEYGLPLPFFCVSCVQLCCCLISKVIDKYGMNQTAYKDIVRNINSCVTTDQYLRSQHVYCLRLLGYMARANALVVKTQND